MNKVLRLIKVDYTMSEDTGRFIQEYATVNSVICFVEGTICGMGVERELNDSSHYDKDRYVIQAQISARMTDNQWALLKNRLEKGLFSKDTNGFARSLVTFA